MRVSFVSAYTRQGKTWNLIMIPTALFDHGQGFASHFSAIFSPIAGEYDLMGKHPEAEQTIRNAGKYESMMEELKTLVLPELELIESRIAGPSKELSIIMKQIRKTITKRNHKVRLLWPSTW